jgi:hypothetical protein
MTHILLLCAVLALLAFIYFLRRSSTASSMLHPAVRNAASVNTQSTTRLSQDAEVPLHHHRRNPSQAVVQPLSWHGSAMAALICALLLVVLAARLWLA